MAGSHKAGGREPSGDSRTTRMIAVGVAAIVLIGAAAFAISRYVGGCGNAPEFTVAADPSIAPVVKELVDGSSSSELGCAELTVEAVEPAAVLNAVAKGQGVPAMWIPDSALWLARAGQSTGMPVDVASDSVAVSPTVVVGPEGKRPSVASWLETLKLKGLQLGDPLTSTVSSAPIVGSLAEADAGKSNPSAVSAVMVPIAQAQLTKAPETDQAKRIERVLADGGYTVASEQQLLASKAPVSSAVPKAGSVFLNYPLAVTEPSSGEHDLAKKAGVGLATVLASDKGLAAMGEVGFRTPNGAPLSDKRRVGKVGQIAVTDQSEVQAALKKYAILALPTRTLAVEDVSGSMAYSAGSQSRMQLTVKASETGVGLFPDNSQVGLWAFSIGLHGDQDYTQMVPIRRLNAEEDGVTHRQRLVKGIRSLDSKIGGGTGLYDTTLAAFREVKKGYDPKAINSVILLTDGANEDPGSISLTKLISTLKKEQDPTQPVIIITIGITEDADADTLAQIAEATGGQSFIARNPSDIPSVFVKALQNRSG